MAKPLLIDLEAVGLATGRKQEKSVQRERLSEGAQMYCVYWVRLESHNNPFAEGYVGITRNLAGRLNLAKTGHTFEMRQSSAQRRRLLTPQCEAEIILRPYQFCNLSELVVRVGDTKESLMRRARIASILGTIQSSFTDFKYLRKIWRDTCNEERLLGVSLTGICDNLSLMGESDVLVELREEVNRTNVEWAAYLGIPSSAATTCVKPSGTVSQLVNSSSGLHTRHSAYYLRTVRADNKDPLTSFLKDAGVYNEPDVMSPDNTSVFYFPIKSPEGSVTRDNQTAIEALELWKHLQEHWCEHKPSATINVKEDEWMEVGSWVYRNFDTLSGVSFLPYDGGTYKQAPYTEVSEDEFNKWIEEHPAPTINWDDLRLYEWEDHTSGSQELACSGASCEVVDIGSVR